MWQRFTQDARRAVIDAQQEAAELGSPDVNTQHLLLALLRDEQYEIRELLQDTHISRDVLRARIWRLNPAKEANVRGEPKLTSEVKRILALSADEARRSRHSFIGPQHLLLGILRIEQCQAAQVLSSSGIDIENLSLQVLAGIKLLSKEPESSIDSEVIYVSMMLDMLKQDGEAQKILTHCGLNIEQARAKLAKWIVEHEAE